VTPDTTPPAPILASDISDVAIGARAAGFTFPASGDDGTTGAAKRYEGRLLAGGECAVGFGGATPFDIPIDAPVPAGEPIALGISPLASSTHYCVAVIAYDDHDYPS